MTETTKTHRATCRLFVGPMKTEILPGDEVSASTFAVVGGKKELDRLAASGKLVELTVPMTRVIQAPPAIPADLTEGSIVGRAGQQPRLTPEEIAFANRPVSKFAIDPDGLSGMDLDDLNVMISERDENAQPCDTVEEAIGILSQDFVPAEGN